MRTTQTIEYSEAKKIIDLITEKALAMQKAVTVAVADSHGELIALGQDQAGIGSRPAANTIRTETGCSLRASQSKTTKQYHLLAGQSAR